ncbi:MAG TPA: ABC transporter ATP-binding protein [Actinomycetota bacterium]|nr:ABC transporter ATP-binding protein [Actinomycetota bacterium]
MADGQTEPVLRLEGVSRRFGGLVAVDGVSLTLGPRRRLAVIGPNGAGKTTLFRLIAGDVPPSQGRIFLFGREVTRLPAHRRARLGLSRTFQVSNLFAGLSVLDNVRLAAQAGQPGRWRRLGPVRPGDRVGLAAMEALERAGIAARAGDRVAELSHGEQRQLEVALALATSPKLLLLDEPAAGLSAGERSRLRELLGSLPDSLPLLLIEHDMTLALSLADEVLCLHNGRPIALGPPDRVRGDPTVQAVYLGRTVDA